MDRVPGHLAMPSMSVEDLSDAPCAPPDEDEDEDLDEDDDFYEDGDDETEEPE